jgi:uroporphyrinogen decarboxylase
MDELTGLERIRTLLAHREPDRIGITDSFWLDTVPRWQTEGFPADVTPAEYFGFDFDHVYIDSSLRLPEEVLEDTDDYYVYQDKHGFTAKRWKNKAGAFGYLEHVIKDRSDWERLKGNLVLEYGTGCRMATIPYSDPFETYPEWAAFKTEFDELRRREKYILVVVYGPFEGTWRRRGFEATLVDLASDPGLAKEMFETQVDVTIAVLARARLEGIVPDGLFLIEDMGYRSGTLFSPRAYHETLWPAHRRLGDYLRSHGIHYFLHSDGDISSFIPDFIRAGFEVLQPMEAKTGLDVRELKTEYGKDLSFMGNIDATVMSRSKTEIEAEIRDKLTVAKTEGGYIYHSDHSVPVDVSLDQYKHVMEMVLKYGRYD